MPDNGHAHPREGKLQSLVVPFFNFYGRVVCMANTKPFKETPDDVLAFGQGIADRGVLFEPLPTMMLTENTTSKMIYEGAEKGIKLIKFIPAGTSFGAVKGLRLFDFEALYKLFPAIIDTGMYLPVHCELIFYNGKEIAYQEREERAIPIIDLWLKRFPELPLDIEHVSTEKMINYIDSLPSSANVGAGLTVQHARKIYDDVFFPNGNMKNPFNFCLPVAKTEADRIAVRKKMISGDQRYYWAPDSAPHWLKDKEAKHVPGVFYGLAEIPRLVEVYEEESALNRFEDFTSRFWAERHGFPLNEKIIIIAREEWILPIEENGIRYTSGGEKVRWRIIERDGNPIVI